MTERTCSTPGCGATCRACLASKKCPRPRVACGDLDVAVEANDEVLHFVLEALNDS